MEVAETVERELGRLDGLVNNAAIGSLATVEDETVDNWERVMSIGSTGVWLGMKHLGPIIASSGGGSIVNVSSILGTVGGLGNSAAYHAAKGAVRTLTKNAALHWATSGVRVNSLHPGFIGTAQLLERYEGTAAARGDGGEHAHRAAGSRRGDRRRRGLPGQRRLDLHDRLRGLRGRWLHRPLSPGRPVRIPCALRWGSGSGHRGRSPPPLGPCGGGRLVPSRRGAPLDLGQPRGAARARSRLLRPPPGRDRGDRSGDRIFLTDWRGDADER